MSIIELQRTNDGIRIDAIGRSRYNNLGGDDIDLDLAVFVLACWEKSTGTTIESLPATFAGTCISMSKRRLRHSSRRQRTILPTTSI